MNDAAAPIAQGRYRLVSRLGQGGMASVYRAWDQRLEVWRAIKLLHPSFAPNPASRTRFVQEARTMARLRHRNLLTVHDVGEEDGQAFIVMDLAPGGSLADRLAQGPLAPRLAVRLVRDVLAGLHHAHEAGVVHRDVKPHNILLDVDGTPLVGDFGIARVLSADLTRTGATIGTLAYMAPEQRGGAKAVDRRADVYAAAGTLYALVVGRDPHDLFIDGAATWESVPDELVAALRRATRHDAGERQPTALALAEELRQVEDRLPASPRDGLSTLAVSAETLDAPPAADASPLQRSSETYADPGPLAGGLTTAPSRFDEPVPSAAAAPLRYAWATRPRMALAAVVFAAAGVGAERYWPRAGVTVDAYAQDDRFAQVEGMADPIGSFSVAPDGTVAWYVTADGLTRHPLGGDPALVKAGVARWARVLALSADQVLVGGDQETQFAKVSADGSSEPVTFPGIPLAISPDGGRIALARPDALVTSTLDGADVTLIEPGAPDTHSLVAWSPDGRFLAVDRMGAVSSDVWVIAADGSRRVRIATAAPTRAMGVPGLAWRPDGRVVFPEVDSLEHTTLWGQLVVDGAPVGEPERLYEWNDQMATAFERAGEALVYLRIRSNGDAWEADLRQSAMGEAKRVTTNVGNDLPLGWFADGSTVWTTVSGPSEGLWVRRPSGQRERWSEAWIPVYYATTTAGSVLTARFDGSPGSRIDRHDGPDAVVTLVTDPIAKLTCGCAGDVCFGGRQIGDDVELFHLDPREGAGAPIATVKVPGSRGSPPVLAVSRDGGAVAVLGEDVIDVVRTDGSVRRYSDLGCEAPQLADWSPDGSALVFSCIDAYGWQLRWLPLDGGPTAELHRGSGWITAPRISPDGARILFHADPLFSELWLLRP